MGMTTTNPDTVEAARLWVIRVQDSGFDDWDGLTEWLAGDPDRLAAYEAALDDDSWAAELFHHQPPMDADARPSDPSHRRAQPTPRRRWFAAGGAIAAALVAVVTFTTIRDDSTRIITAPGEHRAVPLADGSQVILNGGTEIALDPDAPREIRLTRGEALFQIRHDERNPFVVIAGKTRLVDAGTVFNVASEDGALDVAVAEGAVIYEPEREGITLAAGDALSRATARARPTLHKASPQTVGSWKSGRLQYNDAHLDRIARDLGRNLGRKIHPADGADRIRFTGTLDVSGTADQVLGRAGPLLGVNFAADGNSWRMTPAHGAPPS
jgi:transmembrane sensor